MFCFFYVVCVFMLYMYMPQLAVTERSNTPSVQENILHRLPKINVYSQLNESVNVNTTIFCDITALQHNASICHK